MEIGVIGLGKMGYGLACNLKDNGYTVYGYDINSSEAVSYTHLDVYKRQALNNGGVVFAWFKEVFGNDFVLDDVFKEYDKVDNGLLFLPFLNGERAPYWNPKLRGAYLGINHSHTETDFLYSTIQGICFSIKDVFELLKDKHKEIKKIYANGGFTKSKFWIERLSSVLGYEVDVLDQGDAACFGAFLVRCV